MNEQIKKRRMRTFPIIYSHQNFMSNNSFISQEIGWVDWFYGMSTLVGLIKAQFSRFSINYMFSNNY